MFKPLGDRIVVRPDRKPDETLTQQGLILMQEEKEATTGRIVRMGQDAEFTVTTLRVGDRVVYSPWTGFALTISGETLKILGSSEIMGILDDEDDQAAVA